MAKFYSINIFTIDFRLTHESPVVNAFPSFAMDLREVNWRPTYLVQSLFAFRSIYFSWLQVGCLLGNGRCFVGTHRLGGDASVWLAGAGSTVVSASGSFSLQPPLVSREPSVPGHHRERDWSPRSDQQGESNPPILCLNLENKVRKIVSVKSVKELGHRHYLSIRLKMRWF